MSWSSLVEVLQDDIPGLFQSLMVMVKKINIVATHLSQGTLAYSGALLSGWPDGSLEVSCLKCLQVLKGIAYGRKNFCYGQFSCISIITTLSSGQQIYYILRANYCARQDPRIVKYGPFFHGIGSGVVGTGVCAVSVWT